MTRISRAARSLHTGIGALVVVALSATAALADARGVLPAPIKGWKQLGATRTYNQNNLFDLIDGEAQAILGYSFVQCAHAEYAPAAQAKPVLTIDIYDMTDPLNAFGVFSSDRISGRVAPLGAEGVRIEPSGLNFWKGRYVVRTTIVQVNPANKAAQEAFARAVAARITGGSSVPPLVAALPAGRQPRSEKYIRKDAGGHAFLTNAISARYPAVGQGCELFIAQYPAPQGAKTALEAYRAYEKTGAGLAPLKGLGDAAFGVTDKYAKSVVAAQKGRYLVWVHRARDAAGAQGLVRQALAKVK